MGAPRPTAASAGPGEVGGGVRGASCRLSSAAPAREIVKVSGFLGVRLSAVRPGVPAQGPRDRLGGAPGVRSPLSSEPPPSAEPELIPSPAAPARRVVTFRAAVPGALSPRPERVTPLIPGFGPAGSPTGTPRQPLCGAG